MSQRSVWLLKFKNIDGHLKCDTTEEKIDNLRFQYAESQDHQNGKIIHADRLKTMSII
jgi:hypothetical protein